MNAHKPKRAIRNSATQSTAFTRGHGPRDNAWRATTPIATRAAPPWAADAHLTLNEKCSSGRAAHPRRSHERANGTTRRAPPRNAPGGRVGAFTGLRGPPPARLAMRSPQDCAVLTRCVKGQRTTPTALSGGAAPRALHCRAGAPGPGGAPSRTIAFYNAKSRDRC